ncbi:hypothetical protein B0O80DRAFT_452777 [Mortierella sp. GBAus27b]|nr:hypothetical protein B0O80DRAFT_452777 [Mortierella sp. GBAus27b]
MGSIKLVLSLVPAVVHVVHFLLAVVDQLRDVLVARLVNDDRIIDFLIVVDDSVLDRALVIDLGLASVRCQAPSTFLTAPAAARPAPTTTTPPTTAVPTATFLTPSPTDSAASPTAVPTL